MSSNKTKVALVYGFWGQNIGNAFFNIGGRWILDQIFPEAHIFEIQDQPGYRTFNRNRRGNPKNDVGLLKSIEADYIVLQGPIFTETFDILWRDTLQTLTERGTKIILLSAAFFRYTEKEIAAARRVLDDFPPALISTRDLQSYELIKDHAEHTYAGIDSAFFVPKAYTPPNLLLDPYITLNFDQYPEPKITVAKPQQLSGNFDCRFEYLDRDWGLKIPRFQNRMSKAGQWQCYLGAFLDFRKLPAEVDGLKVVRPEHRVNPDMIWKIYSQPNGLSSDEPYTYFTIYSQTQLTLSDRVHACVTTLAYGRPAMMFHPTPRGHIFERVGVKDIRKHPVQLDMDYLETERQKELDFLRQAVGSKVRVETG